MKITFMQSNTRKGASRFPDSTELAFVLFLYFIRSNCQNTLMNTLVSTCFFPLRLSSSLYFLPFFHSSFRISPYFISLSFLFPFFTPFSFLLHYSPVFLPFLYAFQRQLRVSPLHFLGIHVFKRSHFYLLISSFLNDHLERRYATKILYTSLVLYFKTITVSQISLSLRCFICIKMNLPVT